KGNKCWCVFNGGITQAEEKAKNGKTWSEWRSPDDSEGANKGSPNDPSGALPPGPSAATWTA
ncbi:hypothetical protein Csa_001613, partial [Cucumis sativus]